MAASSPSALLGSTRVVAIVRFRDGGDLSAVVDALLRGGIELVEITLDTLGALDAIERAAGSGATAGAGTVLTAEQVRAAAAAGARFVVSPGLVPEVVVAAHELGLEPIPGVFTATELLAAQRAGARILKLFPASLGGPSYVRALRGPFPELPLVPTGGIGVADVSAYLDAGATAVGLGGELVGRSAPRSDADLALIADRASAAVAAARRVS